VDRENEKQIWKKRILDFEASGVTIAEFSKTHGFSVHQYYYWKNKIIKRNKVTTAPPPTSPGLQSQLIKVIPEQRRPSKIPDPVWLANFIKALHEAP
jgi:transposase-like protein